MSPGGMVAELGRRRALGCCAVVGIERTPWSGRVVDVDVNREVNAIYTYTPTAQIMYTAPKLVIVSYVVYRLALEPCLPKC